MSEMLVTIVTPCYNSEKTIKRTIESVLSQTYQDIEYIIIDGASTDGTVKIAESYRTAFYGRMHIVSEPDEGIYYAMNKGIQMVKGELVGIINSDDYYETDAVEQIISNRSNKPYQILYGFEKIFNNGREIMTVLYHHSNLPKQMITHPTCFVTKKLYEDKGSFNTQYRFSADYDFMLKMSQDEEVEFTPVYSLVSNYVLGGASGSAAAYLETHKLYVKYGIISLKKYQLLVFKCKVSKFVKRIFLKESD